MDASILTGVFRLATELNRTDCIVATGGNIAFAAAALASLGVIHRPILGIQCGVLHFKHGFWRRRLSSVLLRRMHTLLFGEAELEPMRRFFDLPADVISVNLFGVDTQFWRPDPGVSRDLVLAVGNDTRRDFSTLVEAANRIAAPVHIVTKLTLPSPLPENVTQHRGSWHGAELSDEKIRELYRRARVVVVPLHPSNQPSGQSVTLQAMACGCSVVLSETEGLWSRRQLRDGVNVRLIAPRDPGLLAACVNELLADANASAHLGSAARTTVERTGSVENFAGRLANAAAALVQCARPS